MKKRPTVLLVGDSIRLSYQDTVRVALHGEAYVLWPADNGMYTTNLLMRLHEWMVFPQADVIHVNAGLWDVSRIMPDLPDNVVPLAAYRANVATLLRLLSEHTRAQLIWALTTSVNDERMLRTHLASGRGGRRNDDIRRYNDAAREEAEKAGVRVNDLNAAALALGPSALCPDGVHFTPEGAAGLGKAVAETIRAVLHG